MYPTIRGEVLAIINKDGSDEKLNFDNVIEFTVETVTATSEVKVGGDRDPMDRAIKASFMGIL